MDLTYELIFGTNEGSFQAASVINRTHGYVHCELKKGVGVYVEGTSYDAHDPELLQWVWATLVDSAMLVHNKFVRPLSPDESEIYYQETKGLLTPLGGIPGETPQTHEDFTEYIAEQIRSGKVRVSSEANDLAPYVLLQDTKPKKLASLPLARVAIGLLPDELREQYGYSFSSLERSVLDKSATISRKIHPYLPTVARFSPKYRKAMKQLGR